MANRPSQESLSHGLMFWLLTGMAVATALPCFLVPPIDALRTLSQVEQQELARVRELEEQVAKQTALSDAIRTDPRVTVRLAQRELNYREPGRTEFVSQAPPTTPRTPATLHYSSPAQTLPAWVNRIYPEQWASAYRHERARYIILFMALSIILFSLGAYGRPIKETTPSTSRQFTINR